MGDQHHSSMITLACSSSCQPRTKVLFHKGAGAEASNLFRCRRHLSSSDASLGHVQAGEAFCSLQHARHLPGLPPHLCTHTTPSSFFISPLKRSSTIAPTSARAASASRCDGAGHSPVYFFKISDLLQTTRVTSLRWLRNWAEEPLQWTEKGPSPS